VKDVLVGEVWLGSGQSNMQFNVSAKGHPPYGLLNEDKESPRQTIRNCACSRPEAYRPWTRSRMSRAHGRSARRRRCRTGPPSAISSVAISTRHSSSRSASCSRPLAPAPRRRGFRATPWPPIRCSSPCSTSSDARENYFKAHPGATDAGAPPAPLTINARASAPGPMRDPSHDQHQPTVLFNGMINPIIPYAIRGAIWYQGESIVGGAHGVMLYGHVMDTMVTKWRSLWHEGDFPFYVVQLPGQANVQQQPPGP